MRFAYADPPYPGQSKRWYGDHPDYAGEVDHQELIGRLVQTYPDGWALSTSAPALQSVLALCPQGVRVAVWHIRNSQPPGGKAGRWHWTWEPVIVSGGRQGRGEAPTVRDVLNCGNLSGAYATVNDKAIPGQKPPWFIRWMFGLLGALPGDQLDDLFPGSGAVGREWQAYCEQPWLPEASGPNDGGQARVRLARRLARQGAPTLMDA